MHTFPSTSSARFVLCVVALWTCLAASVRGNERAEAMERLTQEFHLARTANGVWIVPPEQRLRERLADAPRWRPQIPPLERELLARVERNRILHAQLQQASEALKKLSSGEDTRAARKTLEEGIQSLKKQCVDPRKLCAEPDVREQVLRLLALRHDILSLAAEVNEASSAIPLQYEALRGDATVARLLTQAGERQRLGPLLDFAAELRGQEENVRQMLAAESHFAAGAPVYGEAGQLRVTGLLGDRLPLTFSWQSQSEPTVVTRGQAEAAGLGDQLRANNARRAKIAVGKNRQEFAVPVTLEKLRFGRHVLSDVSAWVLEAEADDVGGQIGPAAFTGYSVNMEPEQLRLSLSRATAK